MSTWLRVIAYVTISVVLGVVLKELGFKGVRLITLLGTVSVLGASILCIGEVLREMPEVLDDSKEYAVAMLKMVGIGYAFGICSDICRELGEAGLAGAVCLFGRVEILTICAPFVKRIIEKGIELI